MSSNLWPNFDQALAPRTPKVVIEEAGAGLSEKTKGLVKFYSTPVSIRGDVVRQQFTLYVRALSYHFPFMSVEFAVEPFYPAKITIDKMRDQTANDEEELKGVLANAFTAPTTISTIQRLMSLAAG